MHLNTEGNSPSLASQKGLGWNRALPAPFKFGNAWQPDGTNDAFSITGYANRTFFPVFTIEFWTRANFLTGCVLSLSVDDATTTTISAVLFSGQLRLYYNSASLAAWSLTTGVDAFISLVVDTGAKTATLYKNGNKVSTLTGLTTVSITKFNSASIGSGAITILKDKIDELRFYKRAISLQEHVSSYNFGYGNNPAQTEGLEFWYTFETGESDTALYPGGLPVGWASGTWGVRDQSPNGFHAKQVNQANNATLGGSITTW
jgi:hypothetical protein